jgi:hypothetical protein
MVAAIIVAGLGIVPVLASNGDQPPPGANHALVPRPRAPQAFGGSSPLVVPAAAFTDNGDDPDGFDFNATGGYVDGSGTACLKAPVYLPRGVTVYGVDGAIYDNGPGQIYLELRRVDRFTGATDVMANLYTDFDSASIQHPSDLSIQHSEIGDLYSTHAYYLTTCLNNADNRLYAVRIHYYSYRHYLPVILSNFD